VSAPTEEDLSDEAPSGADPVAGELEWDGFRDGRVQNIGGLDWAGGKWAEYERGISENERLMVAAVARIRDRTEALNAPLEREAEKFRTAIEIYAHSHRDEILVGRAKSRTLPSGLMLAWRTKPAVLEVTDYDALWEWANGEGAAADPIFPEPPPRTIRDMFSKSGLNEHVKKTKVIPPGVRRIPESETLTVSAEEES